MSVRIRAWGVGATGVAGTLILASILLKKIFDYPHMSTSSDKRRIYISVLRYVYFHILMNTYDLHPAGLHGKAMETNRGKRSILITPQRRLERNRRTNIHSQLRVHFRIPKAKKHRTLEPLPSSSRIVGMWKFGLVLPMVC